MSEMFCSRLELEEMMTDDFRLSQYTSPMVVLEVGPAKKQFSVHKAIIMEVSSFFRAALCGSFNEAKTGIVRLPEDSMETVQSFVHWLYAQTVLFADDDGDLSHTPWLDIVEADAVVGTRPRVKKLLDLYVWADAKGAPRLQNDIVNQLVEHSIHVGIQSSWIELVYRQLPKASPLRRLMVDWYVSEGKRVEFRDELLGYAKRGVLDFVVDISTAYHDHMEDVLTNGLVGPINESPCNYHQHEEGKRCF